MRVYRELAAPPHLADAVECFWSMRSAHAFVQRVPPDGCADILFTRTAATVSLQAIGAMTAFQDFELPRGVFMAAVRFRPGMWMEQLGIPADRLTDKLLPLEDLWGARARRLIERLQNAGTTQACVDLIAAELRVPHARTPVQRAIEHIESRHGRVALDDVARQANLSPRQFRRECAKITGLSPKLLARVLRFRAASAQVEAQAGEQAALAAECGYADQSHFIAEFRRFIGRTPTAFAAAAMA